MFHSYSYKYSKGISYYLAVKSDSYSSLYCFKRAYLGYSYILLGGGRREGRKAAAEAYIFVTVKIQSAIELIVAVVFWIF